MRAVTISRFGGPEVIEVVEVVEQPVSDPRGTQVLARVAACSVNPIDLSPVAVLSPRLG